MPEADRREGPRLALALVALASRIVARRARDRWRREWEGEVIARWEELEAEGRITSGTRLDLAGRALGSVVDAFVYDRGRWRMEGMLQDVRRAMTILRRRPGLPLVVVPTLALGIGANTAMFSVARDVLLRPFPYPDPERVVAVEGTTPAAGRVSGNVSYPNIHDLNEATSGFDAIGATRWWSPALEDDRGSIVVRGATVTANYFSILGVRPGTGRFFRPDEQGEGREPLLVLSHTFWSEHFGEDPAVVGRELRLSGIPYRVIGVTDEEFEDPWILDGPGLEPQVFRTVASPASEWPRSGRSWKGIARVRSDVSIEAAQDEMDAAFSGLVEAFPEQNTNRVMRLVPLRDRITGPARPVLVTLLAAVATLLVIACVNLANLLLGRALDRQNEFAIHKALGAPGWRLFHSSLAEAGLLAVVGGSLGVGLAVWLVDLSRRLGSIFPRPVSGQMDPTVLAFAVGLTVGAGLLFGLAPALFALRAHGSAPGGQVGRAVTTNRRGRSLRRGLVVGQLALSTALLIGAGLLGRSFQRLGAVDLGITAEGVLSVQLHGSAWWELESDAALAQWDAVLQAVRSIPGVESAGAIDYVPFTGDYSCDGVRRDDRPPPEPGQGMCAETRMILPGTLETLDVPLVRGRMIEGSDLGDRPYVVVIDQNLAEALWPGEDPLGKDMHVHGNRHRVVGIVGNMLHFGPAGDVRPQLYLHAPQDGWNGIGRGLTVLARGTDPSALVAPIRAAVKGVNASIAVGTAETLEAFLSASLSAVRFRTGLMMTFAVTALLLSVLGVAGVTSYSVSRRTREMGVRLALGAEPTKVRRLVLGEAVRLWVRGAGLGVATGLLLAGALNEVLLFEIGPRDPAVYVAVVGLLGVATTIACYAPARRASGVDPVRALAET